MTSISCVVIDRPLGPGELLALQCVENLIREDLKPIEEARAFRTLSTVNNWSGNQLAKELGISQSSVAQTLALLNLPEAVQASIDAGDLPPSTAYAISTKIDDPEVQEALGRRFVEEKTSREEAKEIVRQAAEGKPKGGTSKGRGVSQPKLVTSRVFKASGGYRVTVERSKGIDPASLADALREALARVEGDLAGDVQDAA